MVQCAITTTIIIIPVKGDDVGLPREDMWEGDENGVWLPLNVGSKAAAILLTGSPEKSDAKLLRSAVLLKIPLNTLKS